MNRYLEFCALLFTLCRLHKVSQTSGIRSHARNKFVGGMSNSRHLVAFGGTAADLVLDVGESKQNVIDTARKLGLQVADEGDHVHVELDPL